MCGVVLLGVCRLVGDALDSGTIPKWLLGSTGGCYLPVVPGILYGSSRYLLDATKQLLGCQGGCCDVPVSFEGISKCLLNTVW